MLEVRVVEVDVAEAVAGGGEVDDAGRRAGEQQRHEPVHEHEVAEVVRAELRLEPVGGRALGARHDPGVGDEHVEPVVVGEHAVGERPHRREDARSTSRSSIVASGEPAAHRLGRPLALVEVAHAEHDAGAVRRERPGGLHAEPGRRAGDQRRVPVRSTPSRTSSVVDSLPEVTGGTVATHGPHRARQTALMESYQFTGTGVWSAGLRYGDPAESAEAAAELESLGYTALWIPDVGGDLFAALENLLGATPTTTVATGILNLWMHEPSERPTATPRSPPPTAAASSSASA